MPPAGDPAEGEGRHKLGSRKPQGVGATGRPQGGKERGASCCCDLELQDKVGRGVWHPRLCRMMNEESPQN